jgi:hypothetical protein
MVELVEGYILSALEFSAAFPDGCKFALRRGVDRVVVLEILPPCLA